MHPASPKGTSLLPTHPQANEMYDTEFEEDLSDVEDYSGRRSEDSVSISAMAPLQQLDG